MFGKFWPKVHELPGPGPGPALFKLDLDRPKPAQSLILMGWAGAGPFLWSPGSTRACHCSPVSASLSH
ncbi:hypothetical protein U1Q18_012428, partial [Sarracenia purpurea var. burkii]